MMEWTPPVGTASSCHRETASLKAKARRSPNGAYDHRRRSGKVRVSGGGLAQGGTRGRRTSTLTRSALGIFGAATTGDGVARSVRVGALLGAATATVRAHRPLAPGPR